VANLFGAWAKLFGKNTSVQRAFYALAAKISKS
jgi:hypothetical protein